MRFAIVTRDEVPGREERLWYGTAIRSGNEIEARDVVDEGLVALLPSTGLRGEGLRVVSSAKRINDTVITEVTVIVTIAGLSVVTTPENLEGDRDRLNKTVRPPEVDVDYRGVPMVWREGSGAVLMHEAAGHAAEHGNFSEWPSWLLVNDEPPFPVDDEGQPAQNTNLLREAPRAKRRASFTDVPIPRLSNVVVRQKGAPFTLPARRLEILLAGGGNYDPLTDEVIVRIDAADLVDGTRSRRVAPFVLRARRADVIAALRGASGDPDRYPGVVCSSEGQEIVVGSHAPLLITQFG